MTTALRPSSMCELHLAGIRKFQSISTKAQVSNYNNSIKFNNIMFCYSFSELKEMRHQIEIDKCSRQSAVFTK